MAIEIEAQKPSISLRWVFYFLNVGVLDRDGGTEALLIYGAVWFSIWMRGMVI